MSSMKQGQRWERKEKRGMVGGGSVAVPHHPPAYSLVETPRPASIDMIRAEQIRAEPRYTGEGLYSAIVAA